MSSYTSYLSNKSVNPANLLYKQGNFLSFIPVNKMKVKNSQILQHLSSDSADSWTSQNMVVLDELVPIDYDLPSFFVSLADST